MQAAMPDVDPHHAVLVVDAEECDIDVSTPPHVIYNNVKGRQFIGWNLAKKRLGFQGGTGAATWKKGELANVINLAEFHPGAALKSSPVAVVLPDGEVAAGSDPEVFDLSQHGQVIKPSAWTVGGSSRVTLISLCELQYSTAPQPV